MRFGKWIEGITADVTATEAGRHSLAQRLQAVQYYLLLAAWRADEDVEYVHELRVYTRRSMAALRLFSDMLPHRQSKWLRNGLTSYFSRSTLVARKATTRIRISGSGRERISAAW